MRRLTSIITLLIYNKFSIVTSVCTDTPGFYCDNDASDPQNVLCETGFYCTGNGFRSGCPSPGRYQPLTGQSSINSCRLCPYDTFAPIYNECNSVTTYPTRCDSGEFTSDSVTTCTACPTGFECLSSSGIQACDTATEYSESGDLNCHSCPEGYEFVIGTGLQICADNQICSTCQVNVASTVFNCGIGQHIESGVCQDCADGRQCADGVNDSNCLTNQVSNDNSASCIL